MNILNLGRKLAPRARVGSQYVLLLLAVLLTAVTPLRADNPPTFLFEIDSNAVPGGFSAFSVTLDSSNNIYVADSLSNRIVKFTAGGTYLTQWGGLGTGNGQFANYGPIGLAVDSSNNVYVADEYNNRLEKFDSNGNYLTQWGSSLGSPRFVAVDNSDNVYVTDVNNYIIEKFDQNGNYLTQWGSQGSGNGEFYYAGDLAAGTINNVYVIDFNYNRVERFSAGGSYVTQFGNYGASVIGVSPANQIYLGGSAFFGGIYKLDSNGTVLTQWTNHVFVPQGIAVDSTANLIYVADLFHRIMVFANDTNIIAPIITQLPTNQVVPEGSEVTYSVGVVGTGPFAYQWNSNNVPVPGATNASFTLTNVSFSESGSYSVLVTNNNGSVLCNALLTVLPAVASTQPASGISPTGAELNGLVTPGSDATVVWFEWGSDTNYGNIAGQTVVPGNSASTNISTTLSGLIPDDTYHYRLDASNDLGVVYGNDQSFLAGLPPTVATLPARNIGTNQVTFCATINPDGPDTVAYFRWGPTTNYGNLTAKVDVGSGVAPLNFNLPVTNNVLHSPNPNLYHVQVVASNSLGVAFGEDVAFILGPWVSTTAPIHNWDAVAASADGTKLVAVAYDSVTGGPIYTSTNSGATWTSNSAPIGPWEGVASSADGTKLVVAGGGGNQVLGPIYLSTNSGTTWVPTSAPSNNWYSVAASADGTKLAVVDSIGERIYASADAGNTWTNTGAPSNYWSSVASSADGTKLVAVSGAYNYLGHPTGPIYTSTNSGATWISNSAPHESWAHVSSSVDGTTLLAVAGGNNSVGPIYTSTNSGRAWVLRSGAGSRNWQSSAVSADGTKMTAIVDQSANGIYISTNSGLTWASQSLPFLDWNAVASSADGSFLVASVGYPAIGGVYTLQTTPSPVLNLSAADNVSSWLIPSLNFILQQSPDLMSWTDLTNPPVLNLTNLQYQVTLPPPDGNSFFRLVH